MKNRITIALAALVSLVGFISLALPASAAGGVLSVPATSYVGSQYVTVTASGSLTFVTDSTTWSANDFLNSGGCTSTIVGSYTNPPQHVTGTCTSAGTLTGWLTSGSITFTTDSGQVLTITDTPAPVVTPPPAPAPVYTVTTSGYFPTGTYTVTITNTGTANGTNYTYSDSYIPAPASLSYIHQTGFTSCSYRYVHTRRSSYLGNGFVCSGANLAVGQSAVVVVHS